MAKETVNKRREELFSLGRRELVNRICCYSDQDFLNKDENGNWRKYPVGGMARGIRDRGYQMSDKQYYVLVSQFAELTDLQASKIPEPEPGDRFVYEMPFVCGGTVSDMAKANAYIKGLELGENLAGDFVTYGQDDSVQSLAWVFMESDRGVVRLESSKPLTTEQQMIANSYVHFEQTDGSLSARLRSEGFLQVPTRSDTFINQVSGFRQVMEVAEQHVMETAEAKPEVELSDADLEFAEQLSLFDLGL